MLGVVALLVLLSCSGDEPASTPARPAVQAPKPPAVDPLAEARKLALKGQHEEALALVEKALAAHPDTDPPWRMIGQEAIAAGQARALLDRLDVETAIGGRVVPHQLLRVELALASGQPAVALAAARRAAAVDPDAGVAAMARAALAGATLEPSDLPEVAPEAGLEQAPVPGAAAEAAAPTPAGEAPAGEAPAGEAPAGAAPAGEAPASTPPPAAGGFGDAHRAFLAWAVAPSAEAAEPYAALAAGVAGWQAGLLRAERLSARGDSASALAGLAHIAAEEKDPRAVIAAQLGLAAALLAADAPLPRPAGLAGPAAWPRPAAPKSPPKAAESAPAPGPGKPGGKAPGPAAGAADAAAEGGAPAASAAAAAGAAPKPGEAKPGEAKPGEAKPGEAKPGEAKPGEAKASGAEPAAPAAPVAPPPPALTVLTGDAPAPVDGPTLGLSEAGRFALSAALLSLQEGDGAAMVSAAQLAAPAARRAGEGDEGVAALRALLEKMGPDADPKISAGLELSAASLALDIGALGDALVIARQARQRLESSADARREEAAWIEGRAAAALGRPLDLAAVVDASSAERQQVLRALLALAQDDPRGAVGALPRGGLSDADEVFADTVGALAEPGKAASWLERAVAAADRSGDLELRLRARLDLEQEARLAGDSKTAAALRAALGALAPEGPAGALLRTELGARALLDGAAAEIPADAGPAGAAWASLATGSPLAPGQEDPLAAGVATWAQGRISALAGQAAMAVANYREALGQLPLHRQGGLSLGVALDGSQGLPLGPDLKALASSADPRALIGALNVHEASHRIERFRNLRASALDPTEALSTEDRDALLIAVSRARAGLLRHLAGSGPLPVEALRALRDLEEKAKSGPIGPLMPAAPPAMDPWPEELSSSALLSYCVDGGHLYGLAVSKKGGRSLDLGVASKVIANVGRLRDRLAASAASQGRTSPDLGDALRVALIDPFNSDLSGMGRYLILAPDALLSLPFTVLPESNSGLRYLADIRTIATLPSLNAFGPAPHPVETYSPDFLGFGSPSAAALSEGAEESGLATDELRASSRVFHGGLREVLQGPDAKLSAWKEKASRARFIHFSNVPMAAGGGFQLADGPLTLGEIRATPLGAQLAVISTPDPFDVQMPRVRALLDAGVRAVLVTGWEVNALTRARYAGAFYEALARDRPPARALAEGREALSTDDLVGPGIHDPGVWGVFMVFGRP